MTCLMTSVASLTMAQLRIDKKTKGIPSPWRPRPTNRKTTDDFNHAIFGCLGMQCTLDVALSDNTQVTDDVGGCLSKNVVLAVGQSWGGSHDHRISGMDTERIKLIHIRCQAFRQSNEQMYTSFRVLHERLQYNSKVTFIVGCQVFRLCNAPCVLIIPCVS